MICDMQLVQDLHAGGTDNELTNRIVRFISGTIVAAYGRIGVPRMAHVRQDHLQARK